MRLICPNCDAEYEVDASVIPDGGRDVQCSNCGHAWFQSPPEVEAARSEEEALFDPPPPLDAPSDPAPEVAAPPSDPGPAAEADSDTGDDEAAAPEMPSGPGLSLDETVLAVLREEAAREAAARQAEAGQIETQADLGLETAGAAGAAVTDTSRRVAKLKGVDLDAAPSRPQTRREMLPDIEEINSTLRASNQNRDADMEAVEALPDLRRSERSGFRNGFLLMMIIAVLLVVTYSMANQISAQIPAAAGAMAAYVDAMDAARLWLDGVMQSAIGTLRGLSSDAG